MSINISVYHKTIKSSIILTGRLWKSLWDCEKHWSPVLSKVLEKLTNPCILSVINGQYNGAANIFSAISLNNVSSRIFCFPYHLFAFPGASLFSFFCLSVFLPFVLFLCSFFIVFSLGLCFSFRFLSFELSLFSFLGSFNVYSFCVVSLFHFLGLTLFCFSFIEAYFISCLLSIKNLIAPFICFSIQFVSFLISFFQ